MASYTFDSVQAQTDLVWRYERYLLIREYFDRPSLFPPVFFFIHLVELTKFIWRNFPCRKSPADHLWAAKTFSKLFFNWLRILSIIFKYDIEMIAERPDVEKDWSDFEFYATNLYARSVVNNQNSTSIAVVPSSKTDVSQSREEAFPTSTSLSTTDIVAITDELASVRRIMNDLRTHSEEVCYFQKYVRIFSIIFLLI